MTSSRLEQLKKNEQEARWEYQEAWREVYEGPPEWFDCQREAELYAEAAARFARADFGVDGQERARLVLDVALEHRAAFNIGVKDAEHSYVRALAELELERLL